MNTWSEFKVAWNALTESQKNWVRGKANWEAMSLWAVMKSWPVPEVSHLNADGSWKQAKKKPIRA